MDPKTISSLLPILSMMIPIIAIVMGIGIGMLAIFLDYRKKKEMFALFHQQRMAAIEKGIDLPPLPEELFLENGKHSRHRSPHRQLLSGMIWLFVGVAVIIALYAGGKHSGALYGLIPVGIGLAKLIYYFAVGKKLAEAYEAERKAKLA